MTRNREIVERDLQYWNRISHAYDKMLLDHFTAEETSLVYEKFEDEFLDNLIKDKIDAGHKIVLIEIGSGTGRYIERYGKNKDILLIVGIDLSFKMIERCLEKLENSSLAEAIGNKIILIQGRGENLSLSLDEIQELRNALPIVICMFNTLGNIEPEERRLQVLETIRDIIGTNGIAVVSVFNLVLLETEGKRYYEDDRIAEIIVPSTLGNRIRNSLRRLFPFVNPISFDIQNGNVRTTDFYSHWFSERELKNLLTKANLKHLPELTIVGHKSKRFEAKRGIISVVIAGK